MRYSLLDQLRCPICLGPLVCVAANEIPSAMPAGRTADGTRVSIGTGVGPAPVWPAPSDFTDALDRLAGPRSGPERSNEVDVDSGLLICACERWFPIEDQIPELLPDHLRDTQRDRALLEAMASGLPTELLALVQRAAPAAPTAADPGAHYKRSEIGIRSKVESAAFFEPGYSSPFAHWDSGFSVYLLKLFGAAAPLLGLKQRERVIDSGCGYAWTTEWLFRSGFDPIGVDICRTYLDIGVARMGASRPHLVVGDVEHLPLASGIAKAVLAYESFHHVPDRSRAMRGYDRVLGDGGIAVLAEPNASHDRAQVAIDAMDKYGILEKGMDLDDVRDYARGTALAVEQVYLARLAHEEIGARADAPFVEAHSILEGNLFKLTKVATPTPPSESPIDRELSLGRRIWNRLARAI